MNMAKKSNEKLEDKMQGFFDLLRANIGKIVKVAFVEYGKPLIDESLLKEVNDYVNVVTENLGITFIGYGYAIKKILGKNGDVLYENPLIDDNYDLRSMEEIDKVRTLSYGKDIAEKLTHSCSTTKWTIKKT